MARDKAILQATRNLVEPKYAEMKCWAHGWPHVESVEATCEQLAKMEKEDIAVSGISGYLHDLGRIVEEQINQVNRELGGRQNHAFLSLAPAMRLLEKINVIGKDFDNIIGAIAVHSEKGYSGENLIAKILRDADKRDGMGPWGVLRMAGFVFGMKFSIPSRADLQGIAQTAGAVMEDLFRNGNKRFDEENTILEKYIQCATFNSEWYAMLHTAAARELFTEEHKYTDALRQRALQLSGKK